MFSIILLGQRKEEAVTFIPKNNTSSIIYWILSIQKHSVFHTNWLTGLSLYEEVITFSSVF